MDRYKKLERKFVRYKDLIGVPVKDTKQPLVALDDYTIKGFYLKGMDDMEKIIGKKILVRKEVAERLVKARQILRTKFPNFDILITYGFRTSEIQTQRFLKRLKDLKIFYEDAIELYEEIHRSVAVPTIAGHPTGGAVDVVLIEKENTFLDMGSQIYDYKSKDFYVFAPNISKIAKKNRKILRNCMMKAGFAPFDGEWWHFSFGDKEWAYYYQKPNALYRQLTIEEVKGNE